MRFAPLLRLLAHSPPIFTPPPPFLAAVYTWYNQSKEFGEKNIYYDTYRLWNSRMKPGEQKLKQLPEILAASAEFRKINASAKGAVSETSLRVLEEKFRDIVHKPTIEVNRAGKTILEPATLKGNILLHVHLHRKTKDLEATPELQQDLAAMLHKAPELVDGMVDMTIQHRFIDACVCVIRFHQYIVQGLWVKVSRKNYESLLFFEFPGSPPLNSTLSSPPPPPFSE